MARALGVPGQLVDTLQSEVPTPPIPSRETDVDPADVGTTSVACRGPGFFGVKPTQTAQPVVVRFPVQFCLRIGKSAASGPVTFGWETVTVLAEVSRTLTG